jgi:hypothetical protein
MITRPTSRKLQNEKDAFMQASTYKDSTINSYMGSVNDIEKTSHTIEELPGKSCSTIKRW